MRVCVIALRWLLDRLLIGNRITLYAFYWPALVAAVLVHGCGYVGAPV